MKDRVIGAIDTSIAFCFYALFFLIPLVMFPSTYELFEFNKMWTVFVIALLVAFFWVSKMILSGKLTIKRTPLDIPILLFLASQIVSTIFSIDPHVSLWGYYSRFNGGLLSTISYIFLYYAFASNLLTKRTNQGKSTELYKGVNFLYILAAFLSIGIFTWLTSFFNQQSQDSLRIFLIGFGAMISFIFSYLSLYQKNSFHSENIIAISLISGAIVALWGFFSHFGYDPTCLVFRGTFDVSCWTEAFQPKIRIFSTLGQPNWLAAYLSILIPISIAFSFSFIKSPITSEKKYKDSGIKYQVFRKEFILATLYLILATLFYVDLLYTQSQSGFLGFWVGNVFFVAFSFLTKKHFIRILLLINLLFLIASFFLGTPVEKLNILTYQKVKEGVFEKARIEKTKVQSQAPGPSLETDITTSGKIRLIVWQGALNVFKKYPLTGSGVETFAYSYYQGRPAEHNLTSEWDYLYNKAHNEYLNYLATTGGFGLGSYLLMIGWFLFTAMKNIKNQRSKIKNIYQRSKIEKERLLTLNYNFALCTLHFALLAGYITILVSNFFGFSVVVTNLYLFLIPILFYGITQYKEQYEKNIMVQGKGQDTTSPLHFVVIAIFALIVIFLEYFLITFWVADQKYALGYNLDRIDSFSQGFEPLTEAVKLRGEEDQFKDELSFNLATLSLALSAQNESTQAAQLEYEAKSLSDGIIDRHPQNVSYYKTRTKVLYSLSEVNMSQKDIYLKEALSSIQTAHQLAPTDAKISYNLGLLYAQAGLKEKAITTLKDTVILKKDYRDARYALALYYLEQARKEETTDQKKSDLFKKNAKEQLEYILNNLAKKDAAAAELLKTIK